MDADEDLSMFISVNLRFEFMHCSLRIADPPSLCYGAAS
jgi:hypothetical protein